MPFPAGEDCRSGCGGEPILPVLHVGPARMAVKAPVDRWAGRAPHYSKRLGEDAIRIVRHDLPCGLWALAFYDSGPGSVQ